MLLPLVSTDTLPTTDVIGGKALGLFRLRRVFGTEHVPDGLVLTAEFFRPRGEAIKAKKRMEGSTERRDVSS